MSVIAVDRRSTAIIIDSGRSPIYLNCIQKLIEVDRSLIHQMATLNATKLLLLTNQTDPNHNTNPKHNGNGNIFTRISLTPIKRLYRINERNFSRRRAAGFVDGPIFTRLLM